MQRVPQASRDFYRHQQQIAAATVTAALKLWSRMGDDFGPSWSRVKPSLEQVVGVGRAAAAASAAQYTPKLLVQTNQSAPAVGSVNTAAFLATAPDGRSMSTLLDEAPIRARVAVGRGATPAVALESAGAWMTGMLLTVMADTQRGIVGADILQRPSLAGYTRMVNPGACSRCVILAGKWFRWNEGFLRHPNCYCIHVPAVNSKAAVAEGYIADPYEYFHSLSEREQERVFGRSEARAIRDGADIYRVENIRLRGLATAKGNLRYGTPSRMTVDDIYRTAGHRRNAIAMLEREGYILPAGQVPGGAIFGQREGFGQLGKGGSARAASDAVRAAQASGVRDPLNRYTMTAAERRLYDAHYRVEVGRTGVWPRSIGENSADRYSRPRAITPQELRSLELALANERARLRDAPASVRRLADLLGY